MRKASSVAGLTLAEYAAAKHLSVAFLKRLGLRECYLSGTPAVAIPYRNADGEELGVRFRLSMNGDVRFRWRKGSKTCPYGLWQLSKFSEKKYIFIPEGESDSQTLWFHDIPALGLPGANSWKEEWAEALDGFERIYVAIEPDKGGEAVRRWLATSKIRDRVRLVKLEDVKDVSELYLADRQGFRSALKTELKAAQPWPEYEKAVMQERNKALPIGLERRVGYVMAQRRRRHLF
jgi:putative DNA primase/helicase